MKTGPKYKIARRLGASIFEKTQTQKFALSESRKGRRRSGKRPKALSDYGRQLIEKQKVRYTYLLQEGQFGRYVSEALSAHGKNNAELLYGILERRLDNAVFRLGFTHTRGLARQIVSHGHVMVNGRKVTIPSYRLVKGDKISIRRESRNKSVFSGLAEKMKSYNPPAWLRLDKEEGEVVGEPKADAGELQFDLTSVIEYYSR